MVVVEFDCTPPVLFLLALYWRQFSIVYLRPTTRFFFYQQNTPIFAPSLLFVWGLSITCMYKLASGFTSSNYSAIFVGNTILYIDLWAHLFRNPGQAGWYFRKRVTYLFQIFLSRRAIGEQPGLPEKNWAGTRKTIWRRTAVNVFLLVKYPFLLTEIGIFNYQSTANM